MPRSLGSIALLARSSCCWSAACPLLLVCSGGSWEQQSYGCNYFSQQHRSTARLGNIQLPYATTAVSPLLTSHASRSCRTDPSSAVLLASGSAAAVLLNGLSEAADGTSIERHLRAACLTTELACCVALRSAGTLLQVHLLMLVCCMLEECLDQLIDIHSCKPFTW